MRPAAVCTGFGIVSLAMWFGSATANAECTRLKAQRSELSFDGPGSWGPLQDTVTLDCLKYVGSIIRNGVESVVIRDEKGQLYRLKVGDFMGDKTGRISRIDERYIYIEQYGKSGELLTTVKFRKSQDLK